VSAKALEFLKTFQYLDRKSWKRLEMAEEIRSETELVARAIQGEKKALAEIVAQNERLVYNTALRLLADPKEAECVLQETFLKVFQALPEFKGQSSLSTWIYRIATNYALMRIRSRKKASSSLDDVENQVSISALETFNRSVGNNPLRAVVNEELRSAMEKAIAELPAKFRSVFVLKDIEGFSLKEISDMLGLTLAAVKSNLHRARLFLRNRLTEFAEQESL
jgi:RNA polymerase sigma-70 factor (ECF subfamily)